MDNYNLIGNRTTDHNNYLVCNTFIIMPLSSEERGVLEKLVNECLNFCPPFVPLLRNNESAIGKHLTKVEDYVLGQMHGYVIGGFLDYISKKYPVPTPDLLDEIQKVLLNRTAEMKEAIFKQG